VGTSGIQQLFYDVTSGFVNPVKPMRIMLENTSFQKNWYNYETFHRSCFETNFFALELQNKNMKKISRVLQNTLI
jgi:hypothetical protein